MTASPCTACLLPVVRACAQQAAGGEGEAAVDEAEEAAAEAELTQLRGAIAAAKHEGGLGWPGRVVGWRVACAAPHAAGPYFAAAAMPGLYDTTFAGQQHGCARGYN